MKSKSASVYGLATAALVQLQSQFTGPDVPAALLGYMGMPRRYHAYPEEFQVPNVLSTGGASILGLGYGLILVYMVWSAFKGKPAPANHWGATGLEWERTQSPPTTFNFDEDPVIVTEPAYNYRPTSPNSPEIVFPAKEVPHGR